MINSTLCMGLENSLRDILNEVGFKTVWAWPGAKKPSFDAAPATIEGYQTEKDGNIVFMFDLPGVQKEDVTVEFGEKGSTLSVSAVRKFDDTTVKMSRTVSVPSNANTSAKVPCALADGVLTVTIPVKTESQPRKLEIE